MSWLYSAALVAEYLGENFSDGEQSAPLSGSHIQQAFCAPDKMTDFSRLSRFGMTYRPLTENLGEELLMSFRADFPVRTLVSQEKAQELTEKHQECGEKWQGSFTKWSQDSFLWKTHQCSLVGDLEEFLGTWPQWGSMRNGECWERQTLAHLTKETEFGLSQNTPPQELAYTWSKRCNKRNNEKLETNKTIRSASSVSIKSSLERYNRNAWSTEPDFCRVVNGIPDTMDRLKALGNGQVPLCAATAWRILSERN